MSLVEDAIARLYQVPPDEFTALRTQLVATAKQAADVAAAKQIGAVRKPSTAAWVVNQLAHTTADAAERLTDLGAKLRRAQAALDTDQLRELSTQRRRLIDELTREAFGKAALTEPAAALRDDVTGTLNAAIADPDVATRLGRLHRAEHWSGFGDVVDLAPPALRVVQGGKTNKPATKAANTPKEKPNAVSQAKEQLDSAVATVAAAEQSKAEADDELDDRHAEYSAARLKLDEARRRLADAEKRLADAEALLDRARRAGREADELVKAARKQQRERREALEKARRSR